MSSDNSRALYYPYITVPSSPWFTRILLYWDDVGAIVPYEFTQDPDRLGPYMVGLIRERLVHQVMPGAHLWKAPNFNGAFLDYIDSSTIEPTSASQKWPQIHMEKLNSLGETLCERGLAIQNEMPHSPWFNVEPTVASAFMAYLAAVLGQLPGQDYSPVTDEPNGLSPFIDDYVHRKLPIRRLVLSEILPAPNRELEPGRLADFKMKFAPQLREFRREVESQVSELALIENDKSLKLRTGEVVANLRGSVNELATRMEEQSNWPRIDFSSFCAIVGSGISGYQALANQDYTLGLAGAALSVAPAVVNAFRGSDLQLEGKPMAYAALAQSQL